MAQETALYRDDVEQVRRRFAEWRSTHAVRSRLPEELWAVAAELAHRDRIDAMARALDVSNCRRHGSSCSWKGVLSPSLNEASAKPKFLGLMGAGVGRARA